MKVAKRNNERYCLPLLEHVDLVKLHSHKSCKKKKQEPLSVESNKVSSEVLERECLFKRIKFHLEGLVHPGLRPDAHTVSDYKQRLPREIPYSECFLCAC